MAQPILLFNSKLFIWLKERFNEDNHNKYKYLFTEWVENITEGQVDGFNKQMYNEINKTLVL